MNMDDVSNGKIITKPQYVQRESGIITPYNEDDERYLFFSKNYDLIAHYIPIEYTTQPRLFVEDCDLDKDNISRRHIDPVDLAVKIANSEVAIDKEGELLNPRKLQKYVQSEKKCRFCGKKYPEVKFKEKAHALSEQIGNKTVFLRNECDKCNDIFSTYEDSFANYIGPKRTLSQIIGKNNVPTYQDDELTIRIEVGNKATVIQEVGGTDHVEIGDDHMGLELEKKPYVPLDAYKALVAMALSIMPEVEFKEFNTTRDWLIGLDDKYDYRNYSSQVITRFLPGPSLLKVQAWLLRRKSQLIGGMGVYDVPYCHFILEFANYSFQIIVPNFEKDVVLMGRTVNVPMFVSSFDYFKGLQKYGKPSASKHDFSGYKKVEGEIDRVILSCDVKEDVTNKEKDVRKLAEREGVKPLFEARKEHDGK